MTWRSWWTPAALFALALAWTWPAAISAELLGRRADALGTAWFLSAAPRLLGSLHDPLTAFPDGADYLRPDSWTLLLVGAAGSWMSATRLINLVALFGVFTSAWAAEAFARSLGARAPWSLLAGLGYAFSGLGATAWIEGYPYHLADPWLPLCGLWWLRAVDRTGTPRAGALAALLAVLALATSAWHGLAAALLVLGVLLGARLHGRVTAKPVLAGAAVVGLVGAVYAAAFFGTGTAEAMAPSGVGGHATLVDRLVLHTAPAPSVDIDGRSQTAWFSSVLLACALVAPLLHGRDWRVRTLVGTALGALALAVIPLPWAWLETWVPLTQAGALATLRAALGRFPERLGLAWLVAAGPAAALALDTLVARHGRLAAPLLAVAALEAFVLTGLPGRQLESAGAAPSAYAAATGPVLDLWPEDLAPEPAWDLRITNTGCFFQAFHRRPIADLCLLTPGAVSPRAALGAWVTDALFVGNVAGTAERLGGLGFATVAWHPDLYRPTDRAALHAALLRLDPAPAESVDAGEHVLAFAVPPPSTREPG